MVSDSEKVIYYIYIRCTMYTTGCLHIRLTFKFEEKWVNVTTVKYKLGDLSALGEFLLIKAYLKKKQNTSLVHAQTHDLAKLWLHNKKSNSEHNGGATQDLHM